jgi:hypothetical protein
MIWVLGVCTKYSEVNVILAYLSLKELLLYMHLMSDFETE